tara:strand:+ start:9498 stop:10835 length:1338 start_codon:yes stop_codon:yes gene_type:complete
MKNGKIKKRKMKINKIKVDTWIEPEYLAHFLASKFGEEGLSWLDSDNSENGKYSFLGLNPKKIIYSKNDDLDNPFERLKEIKNGFWMGWLSYEAGKWLEPKQPWQKSKMASLWIASYDPVIKFNLQKKEIILEGNSLETLKKYQQIINKMNIKEVMKYLNKNITIDSSKINLDNLNNKFKKNIIKIKKLISQGDIFQANLTTKCELYLSEKYKYLDIYSKIRDKLKAPFGGIIIAKIHGKKEGVLSTSPERFLKTDKEGYVETRPIKGTRPRHHDKKIDALNAIELITNEKDRAENIMIVDLLRNDLGKVCEIGSIIVSELLKLESYAKVHHLTSVVRGKIKQDKTWIDLLKACWPGGSITGAPKIRACKRIYELEGFERGPYCGSFIKIDWDGSFDSNILIRSFILKDQIIKVYAGCGIVNDSNPVEENAELNWKLLPLIESLK